MASAVSDEVKAKVTDKLVSVLGDTDDLSRVVYFLSKRDEISYPPSPYWRNLKELLNTSAAFKMFAQRLADDTKTVEENPKYLATMERVYEAFMHFSENPLSEDAHQKWDVVRFRKDPVWTVGPLKIHSEAIVETFANIARKVSTYKNVAIDTKLAVVSSVDEVAGATATSQGTANVIMVGLAVTFLTYEAICNIRRWWKGEISGKRCVKIIVDKGLTTAAAMGGGVAGSAAGAFLAGPIGYAVGGIVGGIAAAGLANYIADRLTQWLFGLPQDEALENAYRFLGVKHTASNTDVNAAFHKLCRKHHPDKGGQAEDFYQVQASQQLIRVARGQI